MGLREELRKINFELDALYGKIGKNIGEEETSNNPSMTEHETDQYNLVLLWLNDSLSALGEAIDNLPYPY